MARHPGLPRPSATVSTKSELLAALARLDVDSAARKRVLAMETDFRKRVETHVNSLPLEDAAFAKFHTNPFVLLIHASRSKYHSVGEIERDLLEAKLFSSMETSAGRMVEQVVLPIYGWSYVASSMTSTESVLDGRKRDAPVLKLASLKSGPRTLNDEMSENIADAIVKHASGWAKAEQLKEIEFTYGVLYGTKKQSNKKDWHILRHVSEKCTAKERLSRPDHDWHCAFKRDGITVRVVVRIGLDWWAYLGGSTDTVLEMACAAIRACIIPSGATVRKHRFTIPDLEPLVSLDVVPKNYNVSLLQRSQLEWLFFVASHFYDELENR